MPTTVAVTGMRDNLIMSPPRVTEKKAGRARKTGPPSAAASAEPVFRSGFACLVGRPERGQVHPDQRARRGQGRDHQRPPADDPPGDSRHRAPAGRAARHPRHAGAAPAEDAARRAPRQPRPLHADRGRPGRVLRPGPGRHRAGRQVPGPRARRAEEHAGRRDRHQDRPGLADPGRRAAARGQPAGRLGGRDPGLRRRRLPARGPGRRPGQPPARGAAAVPGRRPDRRARADHGGRAGPRGRPRGRPRRAPALDRGRWSRRWAPARGSRT